MLPKIEIFVATSMDLQKCGSFYKGINSYSVIHKLLINCMFNLKLITKEKMLWVFNNSGYSYFKYHEHTVKYISCMVLISEQRWLLCSCVRL
jgi:hypothetical protein